MSDRPTPEATVEAMSYALRDGLACLKDQYTLNRLYSIDAAGILLLMEKLLMEKRIGIGWSVDDVEKLITVWREEP